MENAFVEVAGNAQMIDVLKTELAVALADILKALIDPAGKDDLTDALANMVLLSYVLARRCGIVFQDIDSQVMDKAKLGILESHKLEKIFGDLSVLNQYISKRK